MASLVDDSGTTRFEGTIDGALPVGGTTGQVLTKASNVDGDAAWATSSGTATARQGLSSVVVNIANGGNAKLTWDSSFGPDVLLDRSTLTQPSVLTAGLYAVTVTAQAGEDMTVGGTFELQLELDANGDDASTYADSPAATATVLRPKLSGALTWYLAAGAVIVATVRNHDGAAKDFGLLSAQVQKIS